MWVYTFVTSHALMNEPFQKHARGISLCVSLCIHVYIHVNVYTYTVYSGVDQRKHQSSVPLALVRGIHRRPGNSTHKWPLTRKVFPFDDVIIHRAEQMTICCFIIPAVIGMRSCVVSMSFYLQGGSGVVRTTHCDFWIKNAEIYPKCLDIHMVQVVEHFPHRNEWHMCYPT